MGKSCPVAGRHAQPCTGRGRNNEVHDGKDTLGKLYFRGNGMLQRVSCWLHVSLRLRSMWDSFLKFVTAISALWRFLCNIPSARILRSVFIEPQDQSVG